MPQPSTSGQNGPPNRADSTFRIATRCAPAGIWAKLTQILEMIRFSHTIFALPFALLAAVMAWYVTGKELASQQDGLVSSGLALPGLALLWEAIRWQDVVGILVCMVAARSAAMAFNGIADRRIDAENPRTANRHIPAGVLSVGSVVTFTVGSSLLFVLGTLLFLPNRLPLFLSVPVLAFLCGYSYTEAIYFFGPFLAWCGADAGTYLHLDRAPRPPRS